MASSPELVAHVTRAAVVGATIVALANGGATRSAGSRSTSSVPDAEIPVGALLVVLCELRDLFVLHALSTGDGCCLAPFASQDGLGRRYELADGSWPVVKAWTVRHTRLLKLRTNRDGLLVGPVVGGDAYGGIQARLTSYTGWLEDPLCARLYAAGWQLKRFVMGPLMSVAPPTGQCEVPGVSMPDRHSGQGPDDAFGRRRVLFGSGEVRVGRGAPGVPRAGTALRRQVIDDDVLRVQDVSMLDVPSSFAVDVRVWQLVLDLVCEFEGAGIDGHVERALADVTGAGRRNRGGQAEAAAAGAVAAPVVRAYHRRQVFFDGCGSKLLRVLFLWVGDDIGLGGGRASRFAASFASLTPFQAVLWLGVVHQSVLHPRWHGGRRAMDSPRGATKQLEREVLDCAAVACGVVRDIAAGWDALALTVGFASVEAMLGKYWLFVSKPPSWAGLCRPLDVFTFAPAVQEVCLFHGMPPDRVGASAAVAVSVGRSSESSNGPGLAAAAAATANGDLQLRTAGAHFLDHLRRCTSPEAIMLLTEWARVADPPTDRTTPSRDAAASGELDAGAASTRHRRLGRTPTSSSAVTGLDYRPPIWSGQWFAPPPRILDTVSRGMTAFASVPVAVIADAQRLNGVGRQAAVNKQLQGSRQGRDGSSSSGDRACRALDKALTASDAGSDEARSGADGVDDSWQPLGDHLRDYTLTEKVGLERRVQLRALSAAIVWHDVSRGTYGFGRGRDRSGALARLAGGARGRDQDFGGGGGSCSGDALTLVDRAMTLVAQAYVCSFEELRSTYGQSNSDGLLFAPAGASGLEVGQPTSAGIAASSATRLDNFIDAGASGGGGPPTAEGADSSQQARQHTLPQSLVCKVQLLLTDPPYNTRRENNMTASAHDELSDRDMDRVVAEAAIMLRPGGHVLIFCSTAQVQAWIDKLRSAVDGDGIGRSGSGSRAGDGGANSVSGGGGVGGGGGRSTSGSSARGALGKRKMGARRLHVGAPAFHVDSAPLYVVKDPRSFTSLRGGSTALKNKVDMVVRATRVGLGRTDEYDMVNYRNFNMVPSRFRAHENVIDNVRGPAYHEALRLAPSSGGQGKWVRPEQKGRGLLQELILRYSQPGDIVVDLFAGTLSAAMACVSLPMGQHRLAVCSERDPLVVELAMPRLRAEFVYAVERGGFAKCGRTEAVVRACEDLRRQEDALNLEHQAGTTSVGPPCLGYRLATASELGWAPPAGDGNFPCHSALPPELVSYLACRWAAHADEWRAQFGASHPQAPPSGQELATRLLALKGVGLGSWPVEFQRRLAVEDSVVLRDVSASRLEIYTAQSSLCGGTCGLGVFAGRTIRAGERVAPFFGTIVYTDPVNQNVKSMRYASSVLGAHGPTTREFSSRAVEVEVFMPVGRQDDPLDDAAAASILAGLGSETTRRNKAPAHGARLRARPTRAAQCLEDAGTRRRSVWVVPAPYCVGGFVNDPRASSPIDAVRASAAPDGAPAANAQLCVVDQSGRLKATDLVDLDALSITASRDIQIGEEVLVDYGTKYDFSHDQLERERGTRSTPHTFFPLRD